MKDIMDLHEYYFRDGGKKYRIIDVDVKNLSYKHYQQ